MSSSWFQDTEPSWWHRWACRVLKAGPVPRHVAFIMDGNRRYARKNGLPSVLDGHSKGFDRLAKTLEWCRDLGVNEVTVYAFSIENFKRKEEEVDGLMDLAKRKFQELLDDKETVAKHGVRFRFLGDISRLPADLQHLLAQITLFTRDFDRAFINVCLAYTAQDEMTRAVKAVTMGVEKGLIDAEDISESLISKCLDTRYSPDPDLLVRTSGEARMSDFMLWQSSNCCLHFDNVLWPDYSFYNLSLAVLHYQRHFAAIQDLRNQLRQATEDDTCDQTRVAKFLEWFEQSKRAELERLAASPAVN
uniref:Alkyl transferase n=1 Tax=Plectus sambesii TaxID=2011161 RepID=A0A914XM00_9BILA